MRSKYVASTLSGFCLTVLIAGPARADAAGWFLAAPGAGLVKESNADQQTGALLVLETGMGTSPQRALVFGAVARSLTYFGSTTEFSILQRTTTGGYSLGSWGAALDLGVYTRVAGAGSKGFQGALSAGGPWGTVLSLHSSMGTGGSMAVGLSFGIDWARLTSHRTSGGQWWPNLRLPLEQQAAR